MMHGWGGGIWMSLWLLVFWGGLAALVVFLVRGLGARRSQGGGRRSGPDARGILEARFARGEISEEDFVERKQALGRHAP